MRRKLTALEIIRRALLSAILLAASTLPCRAALDIQFSYLHDTGGFFSGANTGRRTLLEAAANAFEARFGLENFGSIVPTGSNTWSLSFPHPTSGTHVTLQNPVIPANTITIYVGARDLPGNLLGFAEYSYSYFGDVFWQSRFRARDSSNNFDSFGGSISFDTLTPWYFDADVQTVEAFPGKYDFYSVAQHEIAHLLGFTDGANAFRGRISGTNYIGANATELYGGPIPLASATDLDHWREGLLYDGREALMDPTFSFNVRKVASELEFAVFEDIGYIISPIPEPGSPILLAAAALLLALRRSRQS
jgi:hypothetical protein